MARQYEAPIASPEIIRRRIEQHFNDPLVNFLKAGLLTLLEQHETAVAAGGTPAHRAIESLVSHYETILQPNLGERFALDAWLIQDLSENWSRGPITLPCTILPLCGPEWMWQRLPWIEEANNSGQRVYAITLKGRNQLSSVRLLQYPWLCHELARIFHSGV
jgi:hypothetical protein